jgi:VWFA-related protein
VGWLWAILLFQEEPRIDFEERVTLVHLRVNVRDEKGLMPQLQASDFSLSENGEPLPVFALERTEVPGNLLLLFDLSASQEEHLPALADLARGWFQQLKGEDAVGIGGFSRHYQTIHDFTEDRLRLDSVLDQLQGMNTTALYDAMKEAMRKLSRRKGPKTLVVLTDGHDLASSTSRDQLRALTLSLGVTLFAVGDPAPPDFPLLVEQQTFLRVLCQESGGSFLSPDASRILGKTIREGFERFELSYLPPLPEDRGAWRTIALALPDYGALRLEYRRGYRLAGP